MPPSPMIIAHRGWSAHAPENTLAAFKAAIRTGADGIELDVQRTADGAVVIIHDETVDRTTDGTGRVAEMTLEQLSRLDAGGWFDAQYAGERIPTLEELLQLVRDLGWTGLINIELKNSAVQYKGMENDVIRLIHRFDLADQILISSFNHDSMALISRLDSKIETALLYSGNLDKPWEKALAAGASALHPQHQPEMESLVAGAHAAGISVNTWTVNDVERADRLAKAGVDGLITDRPDLLLRYFGRIS